jgi:hypothetical protein
VECSSPWPAGASHATRQPFAKHRGFENLASLVEECKTKLDLRIELRENDHDQCADATIRFPTHVLRCRSRYA